MNVNGLILETIVNLSRMNAIEKDKITIHVWEQMSIVYMKMDNANQ